MRITPFRARISATLLALALVTLGLPGTVGAQTTPLKVAVVPSDIAAAAYYANDLGYFQKAGLAVELISMTNGPAIAAAVASGAVDIGFSNLVSLALGYERGLPFSVVAAGNLWSSSAPTVGILSVVKASPLQSGKDLTGKTVAVDGINNIAMLGVRNWIDATGGNSTTVKFLELPFPEMPEALRAGRIDAASMNLTTDPDLGKPAGTLRILAPVFDSVGSAFTFTVFFSTSDWVAKHSDVARRFTAAMRDASNWGNAHHHESAAIVAKYLKQTPAQIEGVTRAVYGTDLTSQALQPAIALAAKYGVLKRAFPAQELLAPVAP